MLPHSQGLDFFKSSGQDLAGVDPVPAIETLMIASLVTLVMMLPSPSTPTWSVDLTLVERAYLLQPFQVRHLPPKFSLGIDSFDFGMIDISS